MPRISYDIPNAGAHDLLSSMPARVKAGFTRGIENLGKLDDQARLRVFKAFAAIPPEDLQDIDVEVLSKKCAVEEEILGPIALLLLLLTVSLARFGGSVDEFVENIRKVWDTNSEALPLAYPFLKEMEHLRPAISSNLSREELSNEVLPTLLRVETAVDLRVKFESEAIEMTVPVLLLTLITDARRDDVVVQVSKIRLRRLVEQLRRELANLEKLEKQVLSSKQP